jgi:hypothetical protein
MTLIRLTAMHKNRTMTRTTIGSAIRNQLASFVLAMSLALAIAPTTFAQGARGGMASMFTPDFLPRDLPVFVDSLGLEEWQRPILEALLEDYQTNFATAADGVRASMGQLKDVAAGTNPDKIVELISRPLIAWGDEKKALRNEFLASVKSQLSDVQAESWTRLERALRREKALPNGELSGESLNLVMIAREVEAPPIIADAARPALEEYEIKLDEALAARETELEGAISSLLSAMGPNDTGKLLAINERAMQKRVAVRAVQDASLVAIREALGSEYGPSFEKRALRRAFPQVYGPNPINPLFEAATALPDLTDEQKGKLTALRATFQSEHGVIQARYAEAIRTSEPGEPRRRADALAKKVAGGTTKYSESPEIDTIKSERQELYARFRAAIADILNDAQKETIPGFGKPGAELPAGQKYGDAVHLGTGGGGKPSPNSGQIDEAADPNKRPKSDNPTTMEQTKTGGATKEPKPSKAVD